MAFYIRGIGSDRYTIGLCLEKGWRLMIRCDRCDRGPVYWGRDKLRTLPQDAKPIDIAARMVCSACGSDVGEVAIRDDPAAGRGPLGS